MNRSLLLRCLLSVGVVAVVFQTVGCPQPDGNANENQNINDNGVDGNDNENLNDNGADGNDNENLNDNGVDSNENENLNDNGADGNENINDNGDDGGGTSALGDWAGAPGTYFFVGNCPGSGGRVILQEVGGALVLQGLEENGDLPLTLDGPMASAGDVVAFTQGEHDLSMVLEGGMIVFGLVHHPTGGFCDATMTPLDLDCFESSGQGTISLDVNDTTCAAGITLDLASAGFETAVVELDPAPYTTDTDIQTEIVQLELGADTALGPIVIRERDDKASSGQITNVVADENGDFVSGDSFFDVFIEVEISGMVLDTADTPFRLDAGTIIELPPLGTGYFPPQSAEPVKLFEAGTSTQVGWFCHSQHTPVEVVPCEDD